MGTYLPYAVSPLIAIAFPIVFFVCFVFFPSTPKHLLRKGEMEKAFASLKFYRNSKYGENDTEVVLEFEKLKKVIAANKAKSLTISDFCKISFVIIKMNFSFCVKILTIVVDSNGYGSKSLDGWHDLTGCK